MVGRETAHALLYEKKEITCTAHEWEQQVRDAVLDYEVRTRDVGDWARLEFCQQEFKRLEILFGKPTPPKTA